MYVCVCMYECVYVLCVVSIVQFVFFFLSISCRQLLGFSTDLCVMCVYVCDV